MVGLCIDHNSISKGSPSSAVFRIDQITNHEEKKNSLLRRDSHEAAVALLCALTPPSIMC